MNTRPFDLLVFETHVRTHENGVEFCCVTDRMSVYSCSSHMLCRKWGQKIDLSYVLTRKPRYVEHDTTFVEIRMDGQIEIL